MKIIQALKDLPMLEKRIESNLEKIVKYAAGVESGANLGLSFDTAEEQEKQFNALIQANEDLVKRRAELRRFLYITNTTVEVEINGQTKTIAEWIEYREKGFDLLERTYAAMTDVHAMQELRNTRVDPTVGAKVVRFYKEEKKNALIDTMRATRDQVSASLEIVNATTELLEAYPIVSPRG